MSLEAKIDLEKLNKALALKDTNSAAVQIGHAVIRAADTACEMFGNSLELDMTDFVIESVRHANGSDKVPWVKKGSDAKKRGRKSNGQKEA